MSEQTDLNAGNSNGAEKSTEPLIVIASNRGPYSFKRQKDGTFTHQRGEGGLVTALAALTDSYEVLWIAAALSKDDRAWAETQTDEPLKLGNMRLSMVIPDRRRYEMYYNTIANPLLWFIQHELWDTPRNPVITQDTWKAWRQGYVMINKQFADAIADGIESDGSLESNRPIIVFPQDYHLYMVPQFLRERLGARVQIQPFIHIPWPGPDAWRALPSEMRTMLLSSLLASNRVGFQTKTDAFNFVQTCRLHLDDAHSRGARDAIEYQGRRVEARAYPISIDVEKVESLTENAETRLLKASLSNIIGGNQLILRTDRIEPSKNILRGMMAFRTLLESHPQHRGKVQMLALLVPSRLEVGEYQTYLEEIMAEVGMINADFSDGFWEPVRVLIGNNYNRAIAALQLYDVLLVNPIADGMNLVAKEGALVNERGGVIVLSEHAGAFNELHDHVLAISPYDVYSTAEALHEGLTMKPQERFRRAEALRNHIKHHSVTAWFYNQVQDAIKALEIEASKDSTPETP
ncbi:MAG: trehalose-6-phosphate synthase [Chloroflexi bacterium]|nr:trehalose-6-phosphate synthase [Chloroflexota bacterium]